MANKNTGPQKDITGKTFGRWTVSGYAFVKGKGKSYWHCLCECGRQGIIRGDTLKNGTTKSCGCLDDELKRQRLKHGDARDTIKKPSLYARWQQMGHRCNNPNCPGFKYYGARGIKRLITYQELKELFPVIPEGLTIDRIDNNGHYEKGNLRLATRKEQRANQQPRKRNADTP